jgi:hypothetical protein
MTGSAPRAPHAIVALDPPHPAQWIVVNDGVMGGRSAGALQLRERSLVFSGTLNTNGGGFASCRSRSLEVALAPFATVALRVRGDGREYACDLREEATVRGSGVTWKSRFLTVADEWIDVELPLASFAPTWRGTTLRPAGNAADAEFHHTVRSVGFTIADGRDGPFTLEVAAIGAR